VAETARSSNLGLGLAVAAILVNAPRLMLAFLEADGIAVAQGLRAGLLGLTGIATGVVLTGGGAYLAHALAHGARYRRTLTLAWLLVLVCTGVLVTPMLVAALGRVELAQVLPALRLRWGWSAVAVLAVELVAAGAMVAHVARRRREARLERVEEELLTVASERNRLATERERLQTELLELRERLTAQASPEAPPESESEPAEDEPPTFPCRLDCGAVFASSHAERGHLKSCPLRNAS
jgi:MFS family permease